VDIERHFDLHFFDTRFCLVSRVLLMTLLAAAVLAAQEEREYADLQRVKDAATRRVQCDAFLVRHPQSWFLAGVYDSEANASIELGDYQRAINEARLSLRLVPENAPLLVAIASVQAKLGMNDAAEKSARDALFWMDRFARPKTASASEWEKARNQLEESANFVLARVYAARGFFAKGAVRQELLQQSAESLAKTVRANPSDSSARKLQEILEANGVHLPAPNGAGITYTSDAPEEYAGSEACGACHAEVFRSWQASGMARMFREFKPEHALAGFGKPSGYGDLRTVSGPRPTFEFLVPGKGWKQFTVDYTIGSKWQQAYATRLPDGRIHVFPIQYNAEKGAWINYWELIDPVHGKRARVEDFPSLDAATSYQRNCALCHTSQLRHIEGDPTFERSEFREPGVNCEMCHGPSGRHAKAMREGRPYNRPPGSPPLDFSKLGNRDAVMVCNQCHRQSISRELGPDGEMNSAASRPFYMAFKSQPYTAFGTRAFYKDGRFRETTFIGEAFLRSACFRRGQAQCASCHNPHPPDAATNPVSLKFRDDPNRMCLQCHSEIAPRVAEHTHHPLDSEGSRCTSCHMPRIMNSVMFHAGSHQIDDIPQADFTARFGQDESPNACLLCHKTRTIEWVSARLQAW
jgi:predicted CXXCH cytochrome family protein